MPGLDPFMKCVRVFILAGDDFDLLSSFYGMRRGLPDEVYIYVILIPFVYFEICDEASGLKGGLCMRNMTYDIRKYWEYHAI